MKRNLCLLLFLVIILVSFFAVGTYAHSGRTDKYGGHYDTSTGEYHYHHGFPAHDHPDGYCPYSIEGSGKWKDLVDRSSSGSATINKPKETEGAKIPTNEITDTNNENHTNYSLSLGDIIGISIIVLLFFGHPILAGIKKFIQWLNQ